MTRYRFFLAVVLTLVLVAGAQALMPPVAAASSHGEATGKAALNPLAPQQLQTDLALWTVVVFVVLLVILGRYAWGPLAAGLEKREHGIADQIRQAESANQQARDLLAQYEQRLASAKDDVRGILEQARRDAEQVGQELVNKAKADAAGEHERAVKQIDNATAIAIKEIADRAADMAVDLAGKIVKAKLSPRDHAQLIENAVNDFTQSRN